MFCSFVAATAAVAQPGQPPAESQASRDAWFKQRVVEELAAGGVILSRLGVTLELETVGTNELVSLVDPQTNRVRASTKLAKLPADREAAVTAVVEAVVELTTQLRGHVAAAPAAPAAPAEPAAPAADVAEQLSTLNETVSRLDAERVERVEQRRVAVAEAAYEAQAIRFGQLIVVSVGANYASVHKKWFPHVGEEAVEPEDFYRMVERPDLAARYSRRRTIKWVGIIGGGVATLGGTFMLSLSATRSPDRRGCAPLDEACYRAADDEAAAAAQRDIAIALPLLVVGVVGVSVGSYLHWRPHPISESTARHLAAEYNAKLRQRLRLSRATGAKPRSLSWAPFASANSGGLVLSGAF